MAKKTPEEKAAAREKQNKNLKPARTKSEARERGKKGGVKSGEARRKKRDVQQIAKDLLDGLYDVGLPNKLSGREALMYKQLVRSIKDGNLESAKFVLNTAGEGTPDKLDVTSNGKTITPEPLIIEVIDSRDKVKKDEATND